MTLQMRDSRIKAQTQFCWKCGDPLVSDRKGKYYKFCKIYRRYWRRTVH